VSHQIKPHPLSLPSSTPKARKGLKRGRKPETAAAKKARERFNEVVTDWGCFFGPTHMRLAQDYEQLGRYHRRIHYCDGVLDAHHLVEKQWIRRNFSDLPEDELLAILFDLRIGAPLCRAAHDNIKKERIYWDEVSEECKEFCAEVDKRHRHSVESLTGRRIFTRPSMLTRLKLECPERGTEWEEVSERVTHG
jgi:hypothetical protein